MARTMLEYELFASMGFCTQLESSDQESRKFPWRDCSGCQTDLTADEKAELLYWAWNAFDSALCDDTAFFRLGSHDVDKGVLFDYLSTHRVVHVFFTFDVLSDISLAEVPSLARFLSALFHHLINRSVLRPTDAASISDVLLLSWWSVGFASPISYCHLSMRLYDHLTKCMQNLGQNQLFHQLSRYPEHANVFMVSLLRLYTDLVQCICGDAEDSSSLKTTPEDPASRMLGIHASSPFQQLVKVYVNALKKLDPLTANRIRLPDAEKSIDNVLRVLKRVVRCSAMVDSLYQRPDLPFVANPEFPSSLLDRFSRVRDYLLIRACRCLARNLDASTTNTSVLGVLPSQFTCLLHGAVPKHRITQLLSASVSVPTALSANVSSWDLAAEESSNVSFGPHLELVCRSLDREMDILGYASWFLNASDPKDVHLANSVLSRLVKHAALLAADEQFCFALIVRLDRVRKAALPEQNYLKLFRSVLSYLPTDAKVRLLRLIQSEANHSRATPLSRNASQVESRIRLLFNRLVVSEDPVQTDTSAGSHSDPVSKATPTQLQSSLTECNPEVVLDCELLLFTCPVLFLTELVRLPVTRRCPASRLAVHQLLNHISYCLSIPVAGARSAILATPTIEDDGHCDVEQRQLTILQSLLLSNIITRVPSAGSLISDLDTEQFEDALWHMSDPSSSVTVNPDGSFKPDFCISDPIVTTVVHLLQLVPSEIAPLFGCLNWYLSSTDLDLERFKSHTERIILVLFSALWHWCSAQPANVVDPAPNYVIAVLEQCLLVFDRLFVSTSHEACSNRFDIDLLIADVIRQLLCCVSPINPDVLALESALAERLAQIELTLCAKASADFHGLRLWLVWSEATTSIHASRPEPKNLASIPWKDPVIEKQVKRLLALDQFCERFRLLSPNNAPVGNEPESAPMERILPRTLCFILLLAATSDSVCECVIKAAEMANERDQQAWDPEQLTLAAILLGLFLFIRTATVSEQPRCWRRAFVCFDRLVSAGILWVPYRCLGNQEKADAMNFPMAAIYLTDWSVLRGSIDQLSLFTDLLHLVTEQSWSESIGPSRSSLLRLVCNTLSMLVHRTQTVVAEFTDSGGRHVASFGRKQAERSLLRLTKRLEATDPSTVYTGQTLADLRRLQMALVFVLDKIKISHNPQVEPGLPVSL